MKETGLVIVGLTVLTAVASQPAGTVKLKPPTRAGTAALRPLPVPSTTVTETSAPVLFLKMLEVPPFVRVIASSTFFDTVVFAHTFPNANAFVDTGVRPSPSASASSPHAKPPAIVTTTVVSAAATLRPVQRRICISHCPLSLIDASVSPLLIVGPGDQVQPTDHCPQGDSDPTTTQRQPLNAERIG